MIKKSKTFKKLHSRSAWLVITFWEYSTLAEEQEVDLVVTLLDFEKAYDRISSSNGSLERLPFTGMHLARF